MFRTGDATPRDKPVAAAAPGPSATAGASRAQRAGGSSGSGFFQRLVLWGVASALIGFTFWPLVGSGPIREAVFGPIKALSGGASQVADDTRSVRTPR